MFAVYQGYCGQPEHGLGDAGFVGFYGMFPTFAEARDEFAKLVAFDGAPRMVYLSAYSGRTAVLRLVRCQPGLEPIVEIWHR